jgi:hypothetical protein
MCVSTEGQRVRSRDATEKSDTGCPVRTRIQPRRAVDDHLCRRSSPPPERLPAGNHRFAWPNKELAPSALGVSWKGIATILTTLAGKLRAPLWGAELDWAIGEAVSLIEGRNAYARLPEKARRCDRDS